MNLSSIFKDDYVYRIGGDEFVVIIENEEFFLSNFTTNIELKEFKN